MCFYREINFLKYVRFGNISRKTHGWILSMNVCNEKRETLRPPRSLWHWTDAIKVKYRTFLTKLGHGASLSFLAATLSSLHGGRDTP